MASCVTMASWLQAGSAARKLLRFVAHSNQAGVGWEGESPAIGAGSSMKRKFKNTSNIRPLKLVAGGKECTQAAERRNEN